MRLESFLLANGFDSMCVCDCSCVWVCLCGVDFTHGKKSGAFETINDDKQSIEGRFNEGDFNLLYVTFSFTYLALSKLGAS